MSAHLPPARRSLLDPPGSAVNWASPRCVSLACPNNVRRLRRWLPSCGVSQGIRSSLGPCGERLHCAWPAWVRSQTRSSARLSVTHVPRTGGVCGRLHPPGGGRHVQ